MMHQTEMFPQLRAYMLFSSSKGNCAYVKYGSDEILIDAGVSARRICRALEELGTSIKNIRAIFITHEHSDHVGGLEIISKYYGIPVYIPLESAKYIASTRPGTRDYIHINDIEKDICLSEMKLTSFPTPHDSRSSVGFVIKTGTASIGYATDIGHLSREIAESLMGCDHVVIESNHDVMMLKNGDYPYQLKQRILSRRGHLSNDACAEFIPFLAGCGAKSIILAHLSENNNHPAIAYKTNKCGLLKKGVRVHSEEESGDVLLRVAEPNRIVSIL